ncbi:hypothetical protein EVAR_37264_1 [Eumeta japonica]|uniref:Uncharacterized protein n=1 Tax=Eumeta variegata TaxID=151549 RepID=A0A4C1WJ32_EUMVA|nr:hypothetical protein EVAR_37264_1 [Eumeta japonica]
MILTEDPVVSLPTHEVRVYFLAITVIRRREVPLNAEHSKAFFFSGTHLAPKINSCAVTGHIAGSKLPLTFALVFIEYITVGLGISSGEPIKANLSALRLVATERALCTHPQPIAASTPRPFSLIRLDKGFLNIQLSSPRRLHRVR